MKSYVTKIALLLSSFCILTVEWAFRIFQSQQYSQGSFSWVYGPFVRLSYDEYFYSVATTSLLATGFSILTLVRLSRAPAAWREICVVVMKGMLLALCVLSAWRERSFHEPTSILILSGKRSAEELLLAIGLCCNVALHAINRYCHAEDMNYKWYFWGYLLVILILGVITPDEIVQTSYDGVARFAGIWMNPNICALVMSAALLFSVAEIGDNGLPWRSKTVAHFLASLAYLLSAVASAWLLLMTASRGAWIGTLCGYLILLCGARQHSLEQFRRLLLIAAGIAVVIIGACLIERPTLLRAMSSRAVSIGDLSDRAQGNRVLAWKTLLALTLESPLTGIPFSQHIPRHRQAIREYGIINPQAIYTNCHLRVAAGLGLLGFTAYLIPFLVCCLEMLSRLRRQGIRYYSPHSILFALLLGLWFSQGLFEVSTGVSLWMVLAVCEIKAAQVTCPSETGVE